MSDQVPRRRLAAILAADVVGYSRLMQADEAGTLALLKCRPSEVFQPLVTKHRGRIVKLMGDGVLVEFASAVDAVECAVQLQDAMRTANAGLAKDIRIVLRIGINLGDVMVEGGDLYGDGVNIVARLEALADPGKILVSETVVSHVKGKTKLDFEDLGDQNLKNIAGSVQVYYASDASVVLSDGKALQRSKPSIRAGPAADADLTRYRTACVARTTIGDASPCRCCRSPLLRVIRSIHPADRSFTTHPGTLSHQHGEIPGLRWRCRHW